MSAMNDSVLFAPNEAAVIDCTASGGPNNTFMWFYEGNRIEGVSTNTLNLIQVEGGNYTCQVRNAAGEEKASIVLTG